MSKEQIDLRAQVRKAYSRLHKLSAMPELGEFRIFPHSSADTIGNLQRMIEIDLEGGVTKALESLRAGAGDDPVLKSMGRRLVTEKEIKKQRNAVLRAQVEPPAALQWIWDWERGEEDERDPMDVELVEPLLDELFTAVVRVTAGTYQFTKDGKEPGESAVPK